MGTTYGNDALLLLYRGSVFDDTGLNRISVAQLSVLIAKQQACLNRSTRHREALSK